MCLQLPLPPALLYRLDMPPLGDQNSVLPRESSNKDTPCRCSSGVPGRRRVRQRVAAAVGGGIRRRGAGLPELPVLAVSWRSGLAVCRFDMTLLLAESCRVMQRGCYSCFVCFSLIAAAADAACPAACTIQSDHPARRRHNKLSLSWLLQVRPAERAPRGGPGSERHPGDQGALPAAARGHRPAGLHQRLVPRRAFRGEASIPPSFGRTMQPGVTGRSASASSGSRELSVSVSCVVRRCSRQSRGG
jgi:hypothetical protein